MTERTGGGTCHNDKPSQLKGSRGGGCVVWSFLAFSFCCWGKNSGGGGVEERSSLPLGLPFPLPGP